jgi:hypothetical protein
MTFNKTVFLSSDACTIEMIDKTAHVKELPAHSMVTCASSAAVIMQGRGCFPLQGRRLFCQKVSDARLLVNLSDTTWECSPAITIKPQSFFLNATYSGTGPAQLSKPSILEETSLLIGQLWIVAREILFKGRSLSSNKFLDDSREIKLENHDTW